MLFQSIDPLNTPDDALSVTGEDHVVRHNVIGVTSDDEPFGTCGEGIHVGGISGGHFIQVMTNTVVGAQGVAGIFVTGAPTGYDLDAVTVQGNVILDSKVEAFDFGDLVPEVLRAFSPAAVTGIDGVHVTGTSGAASPCANCVIEVFLDVDDTVTETLASLGKTIADAGGNWALTLAQPLAANEGLRTASTTVDYGQIQNTSGFDCLQRGYDHAYIGALHGCFSWGRESLSAAGCEQPLIAVCDLRNLTGLSRPVGFSFVRQKLRN